MLHADFHACRAVGARRRTIGCAKSDASGALIGFDLTGGEKSDAPHFAVLLDLGPDAKPRAVIGDKGYSSVCIR
jgi:hypothetical protein